MACHVINSGCSITVSKNSFISLNESKDIDNKKSYFRAVKEYLTAERLLIGLVVYPLTVILLSIVGGVVGALALPILAAFTMAAAAGPLGSLCGTEEAMLTAMVTSPFLIGAGVVIGGLIFVTLTGMGINDAVTDWFSSVEYAQTQGEKKLTAKLDQFKNLESSRKNRINLLNNEIKNLLNNKDKEIKRTNGVYCDDKVIKIDTQVKQNRAQIKQLNHSKNNKKEIEFINTTLSKLAEQKNNDKNHAIEDKLIELESTENKLNTPTVV